MLANPILLMEIKAKNAVSNNNKNKSILTELSKFQICQLRNNTLILHILMQIC